MSSRLQRAFATTIHALIEHPDVRNVGRRGIPFFFFGSKKSLKKQEQENSTIKIEQEETEVTELITRLSLLRFLCFLLFISNFIVMISARFPPQMPGNLRSLEVRNPRIMSVHSFILYRRKNGVFDHGKTTA